MTQRWVIQWIPIEVFLLCVLLGWSWARGTPVVLASPPLAGTASGEANLRAVADDSLSPVFTPEVQVWRSQILAWAKSHGVDPDLAGAVVQIESCGWADAVSSAGAQGLFQVMPFHFAAGENMRDPATNAARGLAYLAQALDLSGGSVEGALAGYNGGHGMIGRAWEEWPAETRRYVYWGAGIYQEASEGLVVSDRLQEWLAAGGSSLCSRAAQALGLGRP